MRVLFFSFCLIQSCLLMHPMKINALNNWFTKFTAIKHPQQNAPFRVWCDSVGLLASKLEHSNPTSNKGVCINVRSGVTLNAGESAIVIPLDAVLAVLADDGQNQVSPVPELMDDRSWKIAPQQLQLALLLLHERQKGNSSCWGGYIAHLPPLSGPGRERCDTLDRWTRAELQLLRSPMLIQKTEDRKVLDADWFVSISSNANPSAITRKEFDWALDIVRTRAFKGDYVRGSSQRKNDYALLPFIDDLNHRESVDPYFEYPPVTAVIGRTSNAVCWVPKIDHCSGKEIAHAYLHDSSGIAEDFLHGWGFSPSTVNAGELYVEDVRLIVRKDGRIEDVDEVLNSVRDILQKKKDDNNPEGGLITNYDLWQYIITQFRAEIDIFGDDTDNANASDTTNIQRRAIARTFVEGKIRLLQSGMEWAMDQSEISLARS
mmetsp:Transcript_21808/g.33860  ORF Transcript_21808/g.33860 Transcript_21808/m.33860 type:complete len:432 (-) Transcript_21808:50-1345(-)